MNIHLALQVGALFNRNALGGDISGDDCGLTQFDAITGLDVALQLALYHYAFGVNAGFDLAVGAYGQAVRLQRDAALDLAIYIKIFAAGEFALDEDRLADLCQPTGGVPPLPLSLSSHN